MKFHPCFKGELKVVHADTLITKSKSFIASGAPGKVEAAKCLQIGLKFCEKVLALLNAKLMCIQPIS
jgi:hypothetical protein